MIHSKGDKYILELTREELVFIYSLVGYTEIDQVFGRRIANSLYSDIRFRIKKDPPRFSNGYNKLKKFAKDLPIMGVII